MIRALGRHGRRNRISQTDFVMKTSLRGYGYGYGYGLKSTNNVRDSYVDINFDFPVGSILSIPYSL